MSHSAASLLVILSLVTVIAYSAADTSRRCVDNNRSCGASGDCCSMCCNLGQCSTPDHCTAVAKGPCATQYCPPDKECYLQKVQCITAPCPPIPACRPKNSEDYVYD